MSQIMHEPYGSYCSGDPYLPTGRETNPLTALTMGAAAASVQAVLHTSEQKAEQAHKSGRQT